MSEPLARRLGDHPSRAAPPGQGGTSANLADILERVLEKGLVIAGDIQINLLDIELLTIKLRLLIASVDKAKEMGIDWWEHDPALSSRANDGYRSLAEENRRLRAELAAARGRPAGDELPAGNPAEAPEEAEEAEEAEETGEAERVAANERAAVTEQAGQARRAKRAEPADPAEPAEQKGRPPARGRRSVSGGSGTSGRARTSGNARTAGNARTSGNARKRAEPRPRGKQQDEP